MRKKELDRKNKQANRVTSSLITYEDEEKRNILKNVLAESEKESAKRLTHFDIIYEMEVINMNSKIIVFEISIELIRHRCNLQNFNSFN
jgi:hypothetical protein